MHIARPTLADNAAATADLEAIVFGAIGTDGGDGAADESPVDDAAVDASEEECQQVQGDGLEDMHRLDQSRTGNKRKSQDCSESKAAWADPDDALLQVDLKAQTRRKKMMRSFSDRTVTGDEYARRLREQFQKLHGSAKWAEEARPGDDGDDSEEGGEQELVTSAKLLASGSEASLPPGEISVARHKILELDQGASKGPSACHALQFHPDSELLLAAGLDKKLRFFTVDGDDNAKVSSYYFKNCPITGASFTPTGDQVLLTSKRTQMWGLDVRTGEPYEIRHMSANHQRFFGLTVGPNPVDNPGLCTSKMYAVLGEGGSILLCDLASKQRVRTLRMGAEGAAAAFSPSNGVLFSADTEGSIYEWDVGTGRCKQRAKDPWATGITCLALSRTTTYAPRPCLAVGTTSGNIDLFDLAGPKLPKEPTSSVGNLTTSISKLQFHRSGEVLVAASQQKKDALRLIHSGTARVFPNWPTNKTPLHSVTAVDLSRHGGLLAIGNMRGKVLLYRLKHYEMRP